MFVFENAAWIFANDKAPAVDSYYDYVQDFSVTGDGPVRLHISAHTNYAVYVNGRFADCGQLPDTPGRMIYDTLDISGLVKPGENRLLVTHYVTGEPFMTSSVQTPGLIFALQEGDRELAVSSEQTLSGRNLRYHSNKEKMTTQLGFTFDYDANGPETVFAPSVLADKPKDLRLRPVKKLTVGNPQVGKLLAQGVFLENDPTLPFSKRVHSAYLSAVPKKLMIREEDGGVYWQAPEDRRWDGSYLVFDIGCETIGYPLLEIEVEEPTEILVGFGEHLEDLRVRSACGYRNFCFRFTAKPGKNLFFHPFRRLGLRYLQLHIYSGKGCIRQAAIRPTRYPMDRKPMPVTDSLHKRIWEVAANTLDLCMQDYFCDCIWREQSMYPYDGRMELLACYYGFEAPEYAREALRICAQQLRPDKLLEICAPGTEASLIPSYSAVYMRGILEYTQYTGDLSLAREVLPVLHTIAQGFTERIGSKGLIPMYHGKLHWHFYEWQPGMDGKHWGTTTREIIDSEDYDLPLNAFVADGFGCLAQLCRMLEPEKAAGYEAVSAGLKAALHTHFYRPEFGGYATRITDAEPKHELSQGLMLYMDAVPQGQISRVEELVRRKELLRATLGLVVYAYEGMLKNPANRDFVRTDIEERWGMMLRKGCDTFWETERGAADFVGAGALCQGWSAIPMYLFGHYNL